METNIIKEQLIDRSKKIYKEKATQAGISLLYFEERIGIIDSISLLPNTNGCLTPVLWEKLSGGDIIDIMRSLNKNKFYYFKNIKGQRVKLRLKRQR